MRAAARVERRIEVGELLPGAGTLSVAAEVFLPPQPRSPPVALFCLPGGAMNRGYFALEGEGGFSFAAHLAAAGFIVATLDPLGVGGSSRPRDGLGLTPDVLCTAQALAIDALRALLEEGALGGMPLPGVRTVGVGHSMGAMLTAMQQAQHPRHAALVLLGFGTQGLLWALSPEEQRLAGDPAAARAQLLRLAHMRSSDGYLSLTPNAQSREVFAGENADRRGVEALKAARAQLLVSAGLFSMIPGSSVPECAQLRVPLLLAVGDRDLAGVPQQIPASFPASPDVTLLVLAATGHCHFLFESRRYLFARTAGWLAAQFGSA